MVSKNLISTAV